MAGPWEAYSSQPTVKEDKANVDLERARVDTERARVEAERAASEAARSATELQRLRGTPLPQGPKSAAQQAREAMLTSRANAIAKAAAAREFALPNIEQNAANAIRSGANLIRHEGFQAATGMPNPFKGGFGPLGAVPGTPAGDFKTALKSSIGEAFMPAFESLKGAGAISEFEAKSALEGLANLNTGMSEVEFKRQMQRYLDKIAQGLSVARKQASMGGNPFTYEDLMREKQRRAGGEAAPAAAPAAAPQGQGADYTEALALLQAAFDQGASVPDLQRLADKYGLGLVPDKIETAVQYRDRGGVGARVVGPTNLNRGQ